MNKNKLCAAFLFPLPKSKFESSWEQEDFAEPGSPTLLSKQNPFMKSGRGENGTLCYGEEYRKKHSKISNMLSLRLQHWNSKFKQIVLPLCVREKWHSCGVLTRC
jgi:hypothetical protein